MIEISPNRIRFNSNFTTFYQVPQVETKIIVATFRIIIAIVINLTRVKIIQHAYNFVG